jgi:DNA repair exonuclease SbcCD ATPase subunit
MKQVKLKTIHITNYKNIEKLSQDINGNHFIVFGKNGQGKTSLFEVINRAALRIEPKDMADLPIKIGAKNAQVGIIYDIDENGTKKEILVQTIFRPSGTVMKVIDLANNGELNPPIERLAELIGESYDLSPLMDMDGKEQFKYLLKVLGGNLASENFEVEYKNKYAERRVLNKQITNAESVLKQVEPPLQIMQDFKSKGLYETLKELPTAPDKTALLLKQQEITGKNETRARALKEKENIESQIKQLQKRLTEANKWLDENLEISQDTINNELAEFEQKESQHKEELKSVNEYNSNVNTIKAYNKNKVALDEIVLGRDSVQKEMDEIQQKMKASVSTLKIDELAPELTLLNEINEDGETKQGLYYKLAENSFVPFNRRQISYGKMLVALTKLSAYINAGKLNIMHIPAWESLDDESREEVLKFSKENEDLGLQFGIEEVKQELLGIRLIEKKIDKNEN